MPMTNTPLITLPNRRTNMEKTRVRLCRMFSGIITGLGAAKDFSQPPTPPARMPNQITDRNTRTARAASVSSCAVGGSIPGTSEDQFATRMNTKSVPMNPR
jgi:hypothetical protein